MLGPRKSRSSKWVVIRVLEELIFNISFLIITFKLLEIVGKVKGWIDWSKGVANNCIRICFSFLLLLGSPISSQISEGNYSTVGEGWGARSSWGNVDP